ncbi:MAG: UvrD-helicase domain-containing protein [Pseudomonadota bacterium]
MNDRQARERAVDPSRSFLVTAPAGSGKTSLLVRRFLILLTTVEEPEEIVAVTFTRKAAEEMRERIVGEITQALVAPQAADPVLQKVVRNDKDKGWRLAEDPLRLRIQTIDALCSELVRAAPAAAGFVGLNAVVEDAREIYRDAAREALLEVAGSDHMAREHAAHVLVLCGNRWDLLEPYLIALLARRDQWLPLLGVGRDREVLESAIRNEVNGRLAAAAGMPVELRAKLIELARAVGAHCREDLPDSPFAQLADLSEFPAATGGELPAWLLLASWLLTRGGQWRRRADKTVGFAPGEAGRELKKAYLDLLAEFEQLEGLESAWAHLAQLPPTEYADSAWQNIAAVIALLVRATAHLKLRFAQTGQVDFTEILLAAIQALGSGDAPGELAMAMDHRLNHLLVDEFQDTSVSQFELLHKLTAGWVEDDGRTLFLVGDPMQSIYRFRQADVRVFFTVAGAKRLGSVALEPLVLNTNFRTQQGLVSWFNHAFTEERERRDPANQFVAQTAERSLRAGAPVSFHILDSDIIDHEAHCVANIIDAERAVDPAREIAVLVRSRSHIGPLLEILRKRGVAFVAEDVEQLITRPAVSDLMALTRSLAHLDDRAAWIAILRAPWCGVSLEVLTVLNQSSRTTVFEALADEQVLSAIGRSDQQRLRHVREVTAEAIAKLGRFPISEAVARAWAALGGALCFDEHQCRDAERYFELLEREELQLGEIGNARLTELLAREFVATGNGLEAVVEVMTIHRAKGLEFDTVILMGAGSVARADSGPLLLWDERLRSNQKSDLLIATRQADSDRQEQLYAYLWSGEKEMAQAEAVRLLYVALTRARDKLHIVGQLAGQTPAKPRPRSFLDWLWETNEEAILAGAISIDAAPASSEAASSALLRLPLDRIPPVVKSTLQETPTSEIPEFAWAEVAARQIGVTTHRVLEQIGRDGLDAWGHERVADLEGFLTTDLLRNGFSRADVSAACQQIQKTVANLLNSTRGRWLFDPGHSDAHSEFRIAARSETTIEHYVIDRTFIDQSGICWIVDFKTGGHLGGDVETYLEQQQQRYRAQLERYARVIATIKPNPIRLGLYFPALDGWREWPRPATPNTE